MASNRKKYKIVKIALGYEPQFKQPHFEPCSRLYMELLENKSKIKPELRDVEFECKDYANNNGQDHFIPGIYEAKKQATIDANNEVDDDNSGNKVDSSLFSNSNSPFDDISKSLNKDEYVPGMFKQIVQPKIKIPEPQSSPIKYPSSPSSDKEISFTIGNEEESISSYKAKPSISSDDSLAKLMRGEDMDDNHEIASSKELLSSSISIPAVAIASSISESRPSEESKYSSISQKNTPPSLEAISKNQVPLHHSSSSKSETNIANMSYIGTEKDLIRKRFLLLKFKKLKDAYPDGHIPDVNEFMDLKELEREYAIITQQLRVDDNIEQYKQLLTMGFYGLEFVLKMFLKFKDIEGFASQQILNMNKYEDILAEIGEKNYTSFSDNWPAELRLLKIICMNAGAFILTKMLLKGAGDSVFSSILGGGKKSSSPKSSSPKSSPQASRPPPQASSKKMKEPDFDIEDLDIKKFN
jgi:hypothetical protein